MIPKTPSGYFYRKTVVRILFYVVDRFFVGLWPTRSQRFATPSKILIIRPDALGDMLYTIPVIQAIRQKFPSADIHIFAATRLKVLLTDLPDIRVTYFNPSAMGLLSLIFRIRREHFDLGVDFKGYFWSILAIFLGGVKYRVGYPDVGLGFTLHKTADRRFDQHILDQNYSLVSNVGVTERIAPTFAITSNVERRVVQWMARKKRDQGPFGVIHVGSGQSFKRWPEERFREIERWLVEKFEVEIVMFGDDKELTIPEFAGLLKKSAFFIGNSSFSGHLASVLNIPTFTLFHDGDSPDVWRPYGEHAVLILPPNPLKGIGLGPRSRDRMKLISVEQVKEVLMRHLPRIGVKWRPSVEYSKVG